MSVSTEVQRTLVKSPPELWAELSNPEALGRHLGDFGEIKITSVEPETKVEWEADSATGVVHLKQSGWGTKVTLSVTRNPPAPEETSEAESTAEVDPEASEIEPEAIVGPEAPVETGPQATPEPDPVVESSADLDARLVGESESHQSATVGAEQADEPVAVSEAVPHVEPEPKPGFFARLFRKRRAKLVVTAAESEPEPLAGVELEIEPEVTPEPEPEVVAMAMPEPIYPLPPEPTSDLATELASVEAQMTEETTELLTGVLDRLGAAHHRPFSRG
jgi:hypothetical protein